MGAGPISRRWLLKAATVGGVGASVGGSWYDRRLGEQQTEKRLAAAEVDTSYAALADAAPMRLGSIPVIWSVPWAVGEFGLTFDDGPNPRFTPRVLQILADAGAHATFNVMGVSARRYPGLMRDIIAAGHEVGNHTDTHQALASVDYACARREIRDANDAIEQVTQRKVRLFRPPNGELTGSAVRVAAELDLAVLMWSTTRRLDGVSTASLVADAIVDQTAAGDILCMHDGLGHAGFQPAGDMARYLARRRDVELAALPDALTRLAARGLRPRPVSALLRAIPVQPGPTPLS